MQHTGTFGNSFVARELLLLLIINTTAGFPFTSSLMRSWLVLASNSDADSYNNLYSYP